jgi:twitching motility protein PilT
MRRHELDYILGKMLEYEHEVSDLNFTVDKPLQVESFGELVSVNMDPPIDSLTPFQTELDCLEPDRRQSTPDRGTPADRIL